MDYPGTIFALSVRSTPQTKSISGGAYALRAAADELRRLDAPPLTQKELNEEAALMESRAVFEEADRPGEIRMTNERFERLMLAERISDLEHCLRYLRRSLNNDWPEDRKEALAWVDLLLGEDQTVYKIAVGPDGPTFEEVYPDSESNPDGYDEGTAFEINERDSLGQLSDKLRQAWIEAGLAIPYVD